MTVVADVYIMTGSKSSKRFDFEGKEIRTRDIRKDYGEFRLNRGPASSPLLDGDALFVYGFPRTVPFRRRLPFPPICRDSLEKHGTQLGGLLHGQSRQGGQGGDPGGDSREGRPQTGAAVTITAGASGRVMPELAVA